MIEDLGRSPRKSDLLPTETTDSRLATLYSFDDSLSELIDASILSIASLSSSSKSSKSSRLVVDDDDKPPPLRPIPGVDESDGVDRDRLDLRLPLSDNFLR